MKKTKYDFYENLVNFENKSALRILIFIKMMELELLQFSQISLKLLKVNRFTFKLLVTFNN